MAPVRSLKDIFTDQKWLPVSKDELRQRQFLPNEVRQNREEMVAAIILKRNVDGGGFSIGTKVIEYFLDLLNRSVIRQAWVVLTDEDGQYIDGKEETLKNVWNELRGKSTVKSTRANPGWCPDYYWLDENFEHSDVDSFKRRSGVEDSLFK